MSTKNWIKFVALGLIWGSSFMWIKIAVQEIGPLTLVTFRVLFAVLSLAAVVVYNRVKWPGWKTVSVFAFLGFFNTVLPFSLISWSEQYISSGLASILNSTAPLFTIIIASIFLTDDRITLPKVGGLLLGFGGVVVLMSGSMDDTPYRHQLGVIAMLLAACSYAIATVYARRNTQQMKADVQAFGQNLAAALLIWPLAVTIESPFTFPHTWLTWTALAWLGIAGTCVAYLIYFSLLHSVGPTRTLLVTYIFPLVGVILGVLFLNETPGWRLVVGGLLILSGIVIVNSRPQPGAAPARAGNQVNKT